MNAEKSNESLMKWKKLIKLKKSIGETQAF